MKYADTIHQLLDLPMPRDHFRGTVRLYFVHILRALWAQGDGFSSKRPLGSSDWQWVIYQLMVEAGLVTGTYGRDGYLDSVDLDAADMLIYFAIGHMCRPLPCCGEGNT